MLNTLAAALKSNPGNEANWSRIAEILLKAGDMRGLREVIHFRNAVRGDGARFALATLTAQGEGIIPALERYPDDCPFSAAVIMARAYLRGLLLELDPLVADFREALFRALHVARVMPAAALPAGELYRLARLVSLFEPADWSPASSLAPPGLSLVAEGRPGQPDLACMAFADSLYFQEYGPDFVAGAQHHLAGRGQVAVGVVDPDDGARAAMGALAGVFPDVRLFAVDYRGNKLPEMSASVRFILAEEVLRHFACPMVFLDIDSAFPDRPGVLAEIAGNTLALQISRVSPPHLIIDACVVAARPGPQSSRFFADTARYLLGKLAEDEPLWCLDQVALYRAASRLTAAGQPPVNLCTTVPLPLPTAFKRQHKVDFAQREASRTDTLYQLADQLTPDRRPIWLKRPDTETAPG